MRPWDEITQKLITFEGFHWSTDFAAWESWMDENHITLLPTGDEERIELYVLMCKLADQPAASGSVK